MKNKTLSVRVILPVVMSVSIVACIISSMMLFSIHSLLILKKMQ